MKKHIIISITIMAAITACSTDEDMRNTAIEQGQEIKLIPIVQGGGTRALQAGDDICLAVGDKFYVWADQRDIFADDGKFCRDTLFNEWELRVTGENLIAHSTEPQYFPTMNRMQLFALHGNFSGDHSSIDGTDDVKCHFPLSPTAYAAIANKKPEDLGPLLHSVETDQKSAANYSKSDLLYGIVEEMTATDEAVPLHFHHMLSKIEIKLLKGEGLTAERLSSATIQLIGVKARVLFAPKKIKFADNAVTAEATDETLLNNANDLLTLSVREGMLYEPTSNPATTILIDTHVDQTEACILPPQTFIDGAVIKVVWEGKELSVPLTGTIRSGMVYTYNITVDHVGDHYNFQPTVTAWTDQGEEPIDVQ